jgi:uncharacterized protein (TIGR02246 family)
MRKLTAGLTLGLAALAMSAVQAQHPGSHDADVQAIRDTEAQWNRDYQAKDVDKLLAHYSGDAVLMAPGAPPAMGSDAIRAALKEMAGDSALSLKFEASHVEVAKSGDLGFTEGTYNMTMTNPATNKPMNDKGSYVTVYRKQADGSWKAISDIATSSTAPGMPAASQ